MAHGPEGPLPCPALPVWVGAVVVVVVELVVVELVVVLDVAVPDFEVVVEVAGLVQVDDDPAAPVWSDVADEEEDDDEEDEEEDEEDEEDAPPSEAAVPGDPGVVVVDEPG